MVQIETYEAIEDAEKEKPEFEEEAMELITSMGLEGQFSLIEAGKDEETPAERCPYRKMTREERVVYKALLPESTSIERYSDGPIPLRVLQIASHALEFFDSIEVWYNPSDVDPLLVGTNGRNDDLHILARWGDVLKSFTALKEDAAEKIRAKFMVSLKKAQSTVQAEARIVEGMGAAEILEVATERMKYSWQKMEIECSGVFSS